MKLKCKKKNNNVNKITRLVCNLFTYLQKLFYVMHYVMKGIQTDLSEEKIDNTYKYKYQNIGSSIC